jgi:hypothetical protein
MDWKAIVPSQPGFYWAVTNLSKNLTVMKIFQNGKMNSFGKMEQSISLWGDNIIAPPTEYFTKTKPEDEDWYHVDLGNEITIVFVAKGSFLHVYDFDHPDEIDQSKIQTWSWSLKKPSL